MKNWSYHSSLFVFCILNRIGNHGQVQDWSCFHTIGSVSSLLNHRKPRSSNRLLSHHLVFQITYFLEFLQSSGISFSLISLLIPLKKKKNSQSYVRVGKHKVLCRTIFYLLSSSFLYIFLFFSLFDIYDPIRLINQIHLIYSLG